MDLDLKIGCLGFIIVVITAIAKQWYLVPIGIAIQISGLILQELRFRRERDPLRCNCGGRFVPPWDLGFDAPDDVLICDNEDSGDGQPCEEWIMNPAYINIKQDCVMGR